MEIYGADLRGIEGELIRFRVLGERKAVGVAVLGNARKVTAQGTIERCLHAIHTMEGYGAVGTNLRYTVDLSPVEAMVQSPGIDLPLAVTLLRATVMQSIDDLRDKVEEHEGKLRKMEEEVGKGGSLEKRELNRRSYLQQLEAYRQQLAESERWQSQITKNTTSYLLIGKLDITTGEIESPRDGMLGMIAAAKKSMTVIVPEDAEVHATIVAGGMQGVSAIKARDIAEVWRVITGQIEGRPCRSSRAAIRKKITINDRVPDLKDILGNSRAKLALETALAGRHSLLFLGPAGHGKSMLAQAATRLLPDLERDELLEVNKIYSALGKLSANELVLNRPYQEASNTITAAGLFGGGNPTRPGLISAAHRGILFFDEVNLTPETILDQLRSPWANGVIEIQRANSKMQFPAKFQFIGAMNPCKCSWYYHYECTECDRKLFGRQTCPDHGRAERRNACKCVPSEVSRYLGRLSQPIKDRIEVFCIVSRYDQDDQWDDNYSTQFVKTRIKKAWQRQQRRYGGTPQVTCNGDVKHIGELKALKAVSDETLHLMQRRLAERKLKVESERKSFQLLNLARTVADLEDSDRVTSDHIAKAISISGLDLEVAR